MVNVSFWVTGEGLTTLVRDMWLSLLPKNALECLDVGGQTTIDIAIDICIGKRKLIGDTREGSLDIVTDKPEIPYPSLQDVVDALEEQFLNQEIFLRTRRQKVYADYETWYCDREIDEAQFERPAQRLKATLDQLHFVYGLTGKTMADLPLEKLRIYYSDIDIKYFNCQNADLELVKSAAKARIAQLPTSRAVDILSKNFGIDPEALNIENYIKKQNADADRTTVGPEDIVTSVYTSGYIDPKGEFYGCPDLRHISFADELLEAGYVEDYHVSDNAALLLEEKGWIKLSVGRIFYNKEPKKITKTQIQTVTKWAKAKKKVKIYYNDHLIELQKLGDKDT